VIGKNEYTVPIVTCEMYVLGVLLTAKVVKNLECLCSTTISVWVIPPTKGIHARVNGCRPPGWNRLKHPFLNGLTAPDLLASPFAS
jgi:hypothetical protein